MESLAEVVLQKNKWVSLGTQHFRNATDGELSPQKTLVKIKADEKYLFIQFECLNNPFVAQNTYFEHNSEMYNQEVFEVFISAGEQPPTDYLEIEINPNNALFVGWIHNPTMKSPKNCKFIGHQESKIVHEVKKGNTDWSGNFKVPFALLGGRKTVFRLNFYRVLSLVSHPKSSWKANPTTCAYLCWQSTFSGLVPQFHRPNAFGVLKLDF